MGELSGMGRVLIASGAVLVAVGMILVIAPHFPGLDRLGRLPGDILLQRGPVTIFVPLVSSILISILLTIALNLFFRR